ncbi:hypothetical protein BGX28_006081 [Mortierella sp. GBA30]|nr:hypothetical protein BGX28_006081 [Mortierella sp. GBA30]
MVSIAMRQIILMGVICFGTIGMYNAMSSIGNAGKHSPTAQNLAVTSSSIAYIIGFLLAGGTHNMLGPRPCVAFGGLTFFLYAGSMYLAKDDETSVYPPLAGILLGLGAGCIWVTQGAMMMSYPTEDNKGKYIACFWAIFNLGAVLGSVLPLVMNYKPGMDPDDVSPETYIVYMVIMGLATLLAIFLTRPSSIVRDNGDPVVVAKFAGVKAEFVAILSVFCDWRMLLLIPAFFFSNFSYTYQFNDFNGFNFTIRSRSLNSIFFWVAQIVGALLIGYLLDRIPMRRPRRALLGLMIIALLFMATWIGALMMQLKHKWERKALKQTDLIDLGHGDMYTGPMAIYAMFGFCDAAFAVYCYWLMGALSNKHDELSRYAGFFKSIQSLGSAVAAPLDLAQTPLLAYLITNWILCAFSIAAMFLVCRTITDTTVDGDYDDDEAEMEETDSCHVRSPAQDSTGQGQPAAMIHSSSFEGDSSTICATSERTKGVSGFRTSEQRSSWRSSDRTMDYEFKDVDEGDEQAHSGRGSQDSFVSLSKRRTSSLMSAASMADRTTCPSPTYQHPYQHRRGSSARLSRAPCMAEIQDDSSYLAQQSQHLSVPGQVISSPSLNERQRHHQEYQLPSIRLLSESGPCDRPGIEPLSGEAQPGVLSPPMLLISQEPLPSVPFNSLQSQHDPYLYSSWATSPPLAFGSGSSAPPASPVSSSSAANSYLQPNDFLDAPRSSFGGVSSSGSTRYDEDQDMDSVETCSVSSMSSGHDSIPEMSEMVPIPEPRTPGTQHS